MTPLPPLCGCHKRMTSKIKFKNHNFESKDELRKGMSQFENKKGNLYEIRLVKFEI